MIGQQDSRPGNIAAIPNLASDPMFSEKIELVDFP